MSHQDSSRNKKVRREFFFFFLSANLLGLYELIIAGKRLTSARNLVAERQSAGFCGWCARGEHTPAEIRTSVYDRRTWYLPLTRRRVLTVYFSFTVTGAWYRVSLACEAPTNPGAYHAVMRPRCIFFFFPLSSFISKFIQLRYMGQSSVKNTFLARHAPEETKRSSRSSLDFGRSDVIRIACVHTLNTHRCAPSVAYRTPLCTKDKWNEFAFG